MSLPRNGIVIVGVRNQRAVIFWPGVALASAMVASITGAACCGTWYALTGTMVPIVTLLAVVCFGTGVFMSGGIAKGLSTPPSQLRSLD